MLPFELFKIKIKTQQTAKFVRRVEYIFVDIHTCTNILSRTLAERMPGCDCETDGDHITYTSNFVASLRFVQTIRPNTQFLI